MLYPLLIAIILGVLYSQTIAPGLTWAHFSADSGDLITAIATGGNPHPGGYPLYTLLASTFQALPFGTPAFRANLFSAAITTLTAILLFFYLKQLLGSAKIVPPIAFTASIMYALSPAVWGQAVVTEVYALHNLTVLMCLYAVSFQQIKGADWLKGFIFGLSATNHLTALLNFPILFFSLIKKKPFDGTFFRAFLQLLAGIIFGLTPYLLLPLRAANHPSIGWGDASNLQGLFWLVSGRVYLPFIFSSETTLTTLLSRMSATAGLLLAQFGWVGTLIGLFGLTAKNRTALDYSLLWVVSVNFLFSIFYGSFDGQVYLMPVWLCFSIWLARGTKDLIDWASSKPRLQPALIVLILLPWLLHLPSVYREVDTSKDFSAQNFINQTLQSTPTGALLFADGDRQVFPLWYAHYTLKNRPDIRLITIGLLQFDWYRQNLANLYPGLTIPNSVNIQPEDLIRANPGSVACYITDQLPFSCNELSK